VEPDERSVRIAREAEGYLELGLFEEALERAEVLCDEGRLLPFALSVRGECLRSLDRYAEGVKVYEELLRCDGENVGAFVGLGWCRKRTGRLDLALEAMERLLEARPGEGIGLYNLACYCALAGQRERALTLLERSIAVERQYRELAIGEEDFDTLRDDPGFVSIVEEDR
jgi:tetratricopeptide (TPR) repeat protein